MKIAVNTRLLRSNAMDGIGWVSYNLLKHLVLDNPDVEFHFFFDSKDYKNFLFAANVKPHCLWPPAKHAFLNVIWFEWSLKRKLKQLKPDLFFSPDGIICLGWKGKQLALIHDLNFVHRPKELKWSNRVYYNYFIREAAKKAGHITTVSEYSKQDLSNTYNIPSHKIDVIYPAVNDHFKVDCNKTKHFNKYGITESDTYFLFIGSLSPRKNIHNLIKAFTQFKLTNNSEAKLVLAGKEMYDTQILHNLKDNSDFKDDIIFTGRVDDDTIASLLCYSLSFVFIPFFEGFGLPLLEAMECKIPIICSDTTSLPEVAGDAAIYVNPNDINAISQAMNQMMNDIELRKNFVSKGMVQKQKFSWQKSSEKLWEVMINLIDVK